MMTVILHGHSRSEVMLTKAPDMLLM
jgi:hypothetical protein